ncbi:MAG TPA: chloride channel protein [Rhizomicrobium sp.]|jgi:CIC family chloride channel protein|nr:chloride channel protein [Rhizomicrobium sp.]
MASEQHKQAAAPRAREMLRRLAVFAADVRRDLRSSDFAQIGACAVSGAFIGALVDLLRQLVERLHRVDFALPKHALLSSGLTIDHTRFVVVPVVGGLALGLLALWARRYRNHEIVDPVEANALYGGRMSLLDSMRLMLATLISNAAGASLGMEAGYSQLGAGIFSWAGRAFGLRREDLRVFVTAGAGAAIAAAFNAPLAGAFYGFELILAQYSVRALAPVAVACVAATLMQDALSHPVVLFRVAGTAQLDTLSYLLFALMGVLAAGLAILAMMAVTWAERGMRRLTVPEWLRPTIGGALLAAIALYFPQVMGSGHGAIQYHFDVHWALAPLALLLLAKIVASAVSVGSGFRGGLFSSSLFLGCLFGAAFAGALGLIEPAILQQYDAFVLVGMGSVAAAIIGAPLTMVFLVLEATGDFPLTIGVLIGVVTASTIVRLTFGYSFATWRFHQRGLGIRGAHDIGWIADLSVARLMRSDPKVVTAGMSIALLRKSYPMGSAKRIFVIGADGRYAGVLELAKAFDAAYDTDADTRLVDSLMEDGDAYLLPGENVRTALRRFEESETEVLPVLDAQSSRKIVGYMTEAYALRRYAQELDRRRNAELGEQDLFSIGPMPRA